MLSIVSPSKYLSESRLKKAAEAVFGFVGEEFEVNIKFACESCIQGLSKEYMGKDEPTNVLSFNHEKDTKNGDIVVCETVVEHEADELGYKPEEMSLLYVVHGILHLAGFDHKNNEDRAKMEAIESDILKKLGVKIER